MPSEKLGQAMERIIVADDPVLARGSDLVIHTAPAAGITLAPELLGEAAEVLLGSQLQGTEFGRFEQFHAILNFLAGQTSPAEVIKSDRAADLQLAKIVDYVVKLRKIPIVVGNKGGGYVWRVARAYADEGQRMLADGISPILIENAAISASMAQGPLITAGAFTPAPEQWVYLTKTESQYDSLTLIDALKARLLFRQSIEAVRCVEEGVVTDARIADVGAILGCGFASWTGGPLSYIDMLGVKNFVRQCGILSETYGSRFSPPQRLLQMEAAGKSFY